MPKVPNAWRLLITFAAILGLAPPAASLPPTVVRAADNPFQFFLSDKTGFFFFWDPGEWTVVDTPPQSDVDSIRLSHGDIVADFTAFVAPGISATECLQQQLDQLVSKPSIVAVEALTPEGGPPRIPPVSPSSNTPDVETDVVVTVSEAERKAKYAVSLSCHDIESGRSLVIYSVVVPAQLFNQRGWETLQSPVEMSSAGLAWKQANGDSISIPGQHGGVVGTLTTDTACPYSGVFVLARGVGQEDFAIDPAALVARDHVDGALEPVSVFWSLPPGATDTPVIVHPGEMSVFVIVVGSPAFDLSYLPPGGQPLSLGSFPIGCGGGGGGLPVLIDID